MTYQINQIVEGHKAGRFVILGFRQIDGEQCAQLKTIDQNDQPLSGELALPVSAIRPIY